MNRSRENEKRFAKLASEAGFEVSSPLAIKIETPVENKNGKPVKTTTVPDCLISDPLTGQKMHVEITNGSGTTPHKAAQKRVIEAAGIDNYQVITGNDIRELESQVTQAEKRQFILGIFGWLGTK
jgi:hypothetical protein